MPHIVKSFDQDLDEIKNVINEMAGNVETQLSYALQSIDERDSVLARRIVNRDEKIDILWNHEVVEILADASGVTGIKVKNTEDGKISERATNGLFMGIGHTPNTKFLNEQITLDDHGFIITKDGHPDTNIPGVFACGDVQDSYYRQAISAAGSGCMAAIRAERFLEEFGQA